FVLGLVADPIPFQYLNRPNPDKLAEAMGRAVIDTFNCIGCHQVRAGVYEFRRGDSPDDKLLTQLREKAKGTNYSSDFFFADHNAWAGGPQPADRIRMHGIGSKVEDGQFKVFLSQALRFEESLPADQSIRAGEEVLELPASGPDVISRAEPYGGCVSHLLVAHLHCPKLGILYSGDHGRHRGRPTRFPEREAAPAR